MLIKSYSVCRPEYSGKLLRGPAFGLWLDSDLGTVKRKVSGRIEVGQTAAGARAAGARAAEARTAGAFGAAAAAGKTAGISKHLKKHTSFVDSEKLYQNSFRF